MTKLTGLFFTILLSLMIPETAFSQRAILEYRHLLKIAQGNQENDTSIKSYTVKIQSKLKDVNPQQIEMYLDTKQGRKFIFAKKDGEFKVPNSTALFTENPLFVTNQPRGSLEIKTPISTTFVQPKVVNGKIAYKDLFKPIIDANQDVQKVDKQFGKEGQHEFVLLIKTKQPIKFIRKMTNKAGQELVGIRTYKPNEGFIVLAFDELIFRANGNSVVEIPGEASFSHRLVEPAIAKQIRDAFYNDPEDKAKPVIIGQDKN